MPCFELNAYSVNFCGGHFVLRLLHVIYQTRERVLHQDIQPREVGCKNEAQPSFFDRLRGVWIPDETLFRVFDMASQTIHNSWRNSKQKFAKLHAN